MGLKNGTGFESRKGFRFQSSTITACASSLFAEQPDPLDRLLRHFIPFFLVSFFVECFVLIDIRNILDAFQV